MYRKVLVAIELRRAGATRVLQQALALARASAAAGVDSIRVVHVVDAQHIQYSVDPTFTGALTHGLEAEAISTAANRLAELCEPFAIPATAQIVVTGHPADALVDVARQECADLIIIGSHGREGLRSVLGSTANAVLHRAAIDVMTVRIPGKQSGA